MTHTKKNINFSKPRHRYFSNECGLSVCPECGSDLNEEAYCCQKTWKE